MVNQSYPFTNVFGFFAYRLGITDSMVCDGRKEFLFILTIKRRLSHKHFIQQHPIGPPVHTGSIALVVDYFRCNIVRSATECFGLCPVSDTLFAHTKVCYFNVSLLVQHDVIQLQISVDDTMIVEVHYTNKNLCSIETENRIIVEKNEAIISYGYISQTQQKMFYCYKLYKIKILNCSG